MRIFKSDTGDEIAIQLIGHIKTPEPNFPSDPPSLSPPPLFDSNDTVEQVIPFEQLQKEIEIATGISPREQILLSSNGAHVVAFVSSDNPAAAHEVSLHDLILKTPTKDIYVYSINNGVDEAILDKPAPDVEPLMNPSTLERIKTSFDTSDQKIEALESALALAKAISSTCERHVHTAQIWLKQANVQINALAACTQNLATSVATFKEFFETIDLRGQTAFTEHKMLLGSFDSDLSLLSRFPLPSSLSTSGNSVDNSDNWITLPLNELVPIDKLIPWKAKCQFAHEQLSKKHSELKTLVAKLDEAVAEQVDGVPTANDAPTISDAQNSLSQIQETVAEMQDFLDKEQDTQSSCQSSASHVVFAEWLPLCFREAAKVYDSTVFPLFEMKQRMRSHFVSTISKVSYVQELIAQIYPQLRSFDVQLNSVKSAFLHLKHVHSMPAALGAALLELYRRQQTEAFHRHQAQAIARLFGTAREKEQVAREQFFYSHGAYLPKFLFGDAWLHERPISVDISLKSHVGGASASTTQRFLDNSASLPSLTEAQVALLSEKLKSSTASSSEQDIDLATANVIANLDGTWKELEERPWESAWRDDGLKCGISGFSQTEAAAESSDTVSTASSGSSANSAMLAGDKLAQQVDNLSLLSIEEPAVLPQSVSDCHKLIHEQQVLISRQQMLLEDCKFLAKLAVDEVIKYFNKQNNVSARSCLGSSLSSESLDIRGNSVEKSQEFIEAFEIRSLLSWFQSIERISGHSRELG